jgi:hypothetical protein
VGKPSVVASLLADQGILHLPRVSFLLTKERVEPCLFITDFFCGEAHMRRCHRRGRPG